MYGGNKLSLCDLSKSLEHVFARDVYRYSYFNIKANEAFKITKLKSFSVYFFSLPVNTKIVINEKKYKLSQGDALQVEGINLNLSATKDIGFFVSGVPEKKTSKAKLLIQRHDTIYKVKKPWGHELWISGDKHPSYAFKQIFIKKGTKTSLQYHVRKRETNILVEGKCRLHFKRNNKVSNDDIKLTDIGMIELKPTSVIDVFPTTLHRLEAVTDLILYETSTPYLDDVIRVQDDAKRPDGRIDTEHK